jgi:hypothetical protein
MPDSPSDHSALREKVADALAHNDACGPGPVSRGEYLADADALLSLIADGVEGTKSSDLMAELEKSMLRAECDRYKTALERYGRHDSGCEAGAPFFPGRCVCGLHRALAFFAGASDEKGVRGDV